MSCTRCELGKNVGEGALSISIRGDKMHLFYNDSYLFEETIIQISHCPFCPQELPTKEDKTNETKI